MNICKLSGVCAECRQRVYVQAPGINILAEEARCGSISPDCPYFEAVEDGSMELKMAIADVVDRIGKLNFAMDTSSVKGAKGKLVASLHRFAEAIREGK